MIWGWIYGKADEEKMEKEQEEKLRMKQGKELTVWKGRGEELVIRKEQLFKHSLLVWQERKLFTKLTRITDIIYDEKDMCERPQPNVKPTQSRGILVRQDEGGK